MPVSIYYILKCFAYLMTKENPCVCDELFTSFAYITIHQQFDIVYFLEIYCATSHSRRVLFKLRLQDVNLASECITYAMA